jgi:hypothetical protein
MKLYNRLNAFENNRFEGWYATRSYGLQEDTHTISYLKAREQLKEIGYEMGFDTIELSDIVKQLEVEEE